MKQRFDENNAYYYWIFLRKSNSLKDAFAAIIEHAELAIPEAFRQSIEIIHHKANVGTVFSPDTLEASGFGPNESPATLGWKFIFKKASKYEGEGMDIPNDVLVTRYPKLHIQSEYNYRHVLRMGTR